jgi:acyl-CoA hydrolase
MCIQDDNGEKKSPIAALAYVEKTDFISPVKLGDFLQVETQIIYTSARSIRVLVSAYGSNLNSGKSYNYFRLQCFKIVGKVQLHCVRATHVRRISNVSVT